MNKEGISYPNVDLFFELVQVALGSRERLSKKPTSDDWSDLYTLSQEQAVSRVVFTALDKLSQTGIKPPINLLFEWIGESEQIKQQNLSVNKHCYELCEILSNAGFRSCILKGQGNARMYMDPLSRTPGDIDVWVEGNEDAVRNFVLSQCPDAQDGIMHIDFPIFDDVDVEVHYKPRHLVVPKYDKRQFQWLQDIAEEQFVNRTNLYPLDKKAVSVPTVEFNIVHQMSHMMGHMSAEGIGIRHLIDYYYVLKELCNDKLNENYEQLFNYLGMLRFAKGIMWVEHQVLGMSPDCFIVQPSEKIGKLILRDVLDGGNFGRYRKTHYLREKGMIWRVIIDTHRLIRLFPVQPSQVSWRLINKFVKVSRIPIHLFCFWGRGQTKDKQNFEKKTIHFMA